MANIISTSVSLKDGRSPADLRSWAQKNLGLELPTSIVMLQRVLAAGHVVEVDIALQTDAIPDRRMTVTTADIHQEVNITTLVSYTGTMSDVVTGVKRELVLTGKMDFGDSSMTLRLDLEHFVSGAATLKRLQENTWLVARPLNTWLVYNLRR